MQSNSRALLDPAAIRAPFKKVIFRDVSTARNVYSVHKFGKTIDVRRFSTYLTSIPNQ